MKKILWAFVLTLVLFGYSVSPERLVAEEVQEIVVEVEPGINVPDEAEPTPTTSPTSVEARLSDAVALDLVAPPDATKVAYGVRYFSRVLNQRNIVKVSPLLAEYLQGYSQQWGVQAEVLMQQEVHYLVFDLQATCAQFVVSGRGEEGELPFSMMTVDEFAKIYGLFGAINGGPHAWNRGDPTKAGSVHGKHGGMVHYAEGVNLSGGDLSEFTLYLSQPDETGMIQAEFGTPPNSEAWNAISGQKWLLKDGQYVPGNSKWTQRTIVVLSEDRRHMVWIVTSGRDRGKAYGLNQEAMAALVRDLGPQFTDAMVFDGGGSSSMFLTGQETFQQDRPVGTHIGFRLPGSANYEGCPVN